MDNKKLFYEWIGVIIALACCCAFLLYPLRADSSVDEHEKQTAEYLNQLSSLSQEEIQAQVNVAQQELSLLREDGDDNIHLRFKNAMVLGDSIVEGLKVYQVLSQENVNSMRGKRIDNMDEQLEVAIQKQPKQLFLCYGMNDLYYRDGNVDAFIEEYENRIDEIKKALPKTEIYVNLIVPIREDTIAQSPDLQYYNEFNKALEAMCKKKKMTCIDSSYIVKNLADPYEFDGIHMKYAFYPLWAENMAKAAGI